MNPCKVAQKAGAASELVVGVSMTLGSEYVPQVPCVILSLGQVLFGKTMTDPSSGLIYPMRVLSQRTFILECFVKALANDQSM